MALDSPLTGALTRSAYFGQPLSAPGVDPSHGENTAEDDVFTPVHDYEPHAGVVWDDKNDTPPLAGAPVTPFSHTGVQATPIPSGTADWRAKATAAMISAHERIEYGSDAKPVYKNATQEERWDWVPDGGPHEAGISAPEWFVVGQNAYDASNPSTTMYDGGRYRLGRRIARFGEYNFWQKQGQDAELRAVGFRAPYLPQDTPAIENPTPRSKVTSGTTRWRRTAFNVPQLFSTPGKEAMTDISVMQQGSMDGAYQGYSSGDFQ